jgi:hypothetical protein
MARIEMQYCELAWMTFRNGTTLPKHFRIIGDWYIRFLDSDQEVLSLHVPQYDKSELVPLLEFLRVISLLKRISRQTSSTKPLKGLALFNIFSCKSNGTFYHDTPFLEISEHDDVFLKCKDDIITRTDRFLPIFRSEQFTNTKDWRPLQAIFPVFNILAKQRLICFPVIIDLEQDKCVTVAIGVPLEKKIMFHEIQYDRSTKESIVQEEDKLVEMEQNNSLKHLIILKYPKNRTIHEWLLEHGEKRFELVLNERFSHGDIRDKEVHLLPSELYSEGPEIISPNIHVVDTEHNKELFDLMSRFVSDWYEIGMNRFTNPFPRHWILFLNPSTSLDEWMRLFQMDYPSLSNKPIINLIRKLFEALLNLDWTSKCNSTFLGAEIIRPNEEITSKKGLNVCWQYFHQFLKINYDSTFIDNYLIPFHEGGQLLTIDPFNIIAIVNSLQNKQDISLVIPDFLYYCYQPWLPYHIFSYQTKAIDDGCRKNIVDVSKEIHEKVQLERESIIQNVKNNLKTYKRKYQFEVREEEESPNSMISDILIFTADEEVAKAVVPDKNERQNRYMVVTTDGQERELRAGQRILLKRSVFIDTYVQELVHGDEFILMNEVNESLDVNNIIDKYSRIPESVKDFQVRLNDYENVFELLKWKGLEIQTSNYFYSHYCKNKNEITTDNFILPRRKNDWRLICEILDIEQLEMETAWVVHFGRRNINILKDLCFGILQKWLNEEQFSEQDDAALIKEITSEVRSEVLVSDEDKENELSQLVSHLVNTMRNEIKLKKVFEVKKIQE